MELMKLSDVAELVGQHVQSVRVMTWERTDGFPQVVPMTGRRPAIRGVWYVADEVRDWVLRRAVRDAVAEAKGQKLMGRPTKGKSQRKVLAVTENMGAAS